MNQYTIPQFIVDAFTDTVFKGNPAAVCLLDKWLSDDTVLIRLVPEPHLRLG